MLNDMRAKVVSRPLTLHFKVLGGKNRYAKLQRFLNAGDKSCVDMSTSISKTQEKNTFFQI